MARLVALVAVVLVSLVAAPEADASCMFVTTVSPPSGASVPPGATTYINPAFRNAAITAHAGGQRLPIAVRPANPSGDVLAVTVDARGHDAYELRSDAGSDLYTLDERPESRVIARYRVSSSASIGSGREVAIEDVALYDDGGTVAPCASFNFLELTVSEPAAAYHVAFAPTADAYHRGERQIAVVPRADGEDGNVILVGHMACSQFVVDLGPYTDIHIGIAAIDANGRFDPPTKPRHIDLTKTPRKSLFTIEHDEVENLMRPEGLVRLDPEPDLVRAPSGTPLRHRLGGLLVGLVLGWPAGTRLGRRLVSRRSARDQ